MGEVAQVERWGFGGRLRRLVRAHGLAFLAGFAFACVAPVSAPAALLPQAPFGSSGSGDGEVELIAPDLEELIAGSGLAVNEATHNVYVGDTDNHRVTVFAANGTFLFAFGADVGGTGVDVCSIGCVAGTPGTTPGAFEDPTFVAVDNSASPSNGDVYVVDSATNVVSKFEADGTLVASWGTGGQLSGDGTETFGQIGGIAVDLTGNLDVFKSAPTPRNIFKFEEDGTFDEKFVAAGAASPGGLAVDSSGDFFKMEGTPRAQKLNPDGTAIGRVSLPENSAGLALDTSTGDLFVVLTTGTINRYAFEPSGEVVGTGCTPAPGAGCPPTETLPPGGLTEGGGLAVDSVTHTVYAADPSTDQITPYAEVNTPTATTKPANPVGAESATLNGEVNPNGAPLTECFFEWGETEAYGQTAACEDPDFEEVGEDSSFVGVHADIAGLEPSTIYHFKLVTANADGSAEGDDEAFQTLGPSIREESVSQVTASGARIGAEINPNGEATSFIVEYVTEAQFLINGFTDATKVPVTPQEVGNGTVFKAVVQQLSGLAPQTTYRARLVATNADATVVGAELKFTTFALPGADLPDNRKYEMVSPPQKTGEVIPPEPDANLTESCSECLPGINVRTMAMQADPDGESVLYEGQPFSAGLAAGPNEYVAERGEEEWGSASLSSPSTTGTYEAFSSDLSQGVLQQAHPALSPEAPTRGGIGFPNLYLRDEEGSFEPLVTVEPPQREPTGFSIRYAGANAGATFVGEFSRLIFEANDALTEEVPGIAPAAPAVEGPCSFTADTCNLYAWQEGELSLVNVLPDESAATSAVFGAGRLLAVGNPGYEAPNVDHAISADGSRIFFSDEASGQVFVRVDGTETLEIPGPGLCKASVPLLQRACFLTATPDGSSVLLSDGQLYELDEDEEAYEPTADLTEGEGGLRGILGASEDLTRVYFIDTEALSEESEENANGEHAEVGKLNLYGWDEGETSFIGALLARDNALALEGRYGTWKAARPNRTAQVSEDGRYLAFMSQAPLTGYGNAVSGKSECLKGGGPACQQVFVYAAEAGTLHCASCNPSGQRPIGPSNLSLLRPGGPPALGYPPFPQPGNLSSDGEGRVFFESQDALLPQDTNGSVQDIYEWEPQGVGSCEETGGCVHLITSGKGAGDSLFLDSTPSGDDVFFITREQLLLRDKDEQLDLYDARVDGGFEETPIGPCAGEACKGPIAPPPSQPSAASGGFVGPGNPPAKPTCRKGFVKKKGKCVKKPKKKGKGQRAKRGGVK